MRVLVACEFSGIVRDAFLAAGHDAWSCDIEPSERPGPHFRCDLVADGWLRLPPGSWDLLIAHPPCDWLANSGVRWRVERQEWDEVREAGRFFRSFLECPVKRIAVENPVMHRYGVEAVGRRQDFTCQPWQFGDPVRKRVCWWTKNLPPLRKTSRMTSSQAHPTVHREPPGPERKKNRSRFFPGMAAAMASQWGNPDG